MKKYVLTENKKVSLLDEETKKYVDIVVWQIRAIRDFGNIRKGDFGGWVASEDNLSHDGNCWIMPDAIVYGNARIYDNAIISCFARVFDNASVHDDSVVRGSAKIFGCAKICGSSIIYDDAKISENTYIESSLVHNIATIYGLAKVIKSDVHGGACISGNAVVEVTTMNGNTAVSEYAKVSHSTLSNTCKISGMSKVNNCDISDNVNVQSGNIINSVLDHNWVLSIPDGCKIIDAYIGSEYDLIYSTNIGGPGCSILAYEHKLNHAIMISSSNPEFNGSLTEFKQFVDKCWWDEPYKAEVELLIKNIEAHFKPTIEVEEEPPLQKYSVSIHEYISVGTHEFAARSIAEAEKMAIDAYFNDPTKYEDVDALISKHIEVTNLDTSESTDWHEFEDEDMYGLQTI